MAGTINTGTPGFDIDGKTYVADVGDVDAPGIPPVPTDHADVHVDKTVKDISKKTKTTLAQYLSNLTHGKEGSALGTANAYPISAPAFPTVAEFGTSDAHGNPPPLTNGDNNPEFTPRPAIGPVFDSPDLK